LPSGAGDGQGAGGPGPGRRRPGPGAAAPTLSAAGRAQGLALRFGRGRVVVLGEASQITAQLAGPAQRPMGMNYPNCDNRQWTLNIMHWLSGLLNDDANDDSPAEKKAQPNAPPAAPRGTRSPGPQAGNQTPAILAGPADWRFERMPIPPRFAPDIKLSGFEEARFAPGMFNTAASEYFTYILAVSIDGTQAIDAAGVKDFLDEYYRGLSVAVGRRKQLAPDVAQINAMVTPAKATGAAVCYTAQVPFFDTFNDGRKIELNVEVKITPRLTDKKTFMVLLISPQSPGAEAWKKLREIEKTIRLDER
jgi:hypothetical protein